MVETVVVCEGCCGCAPVVAVLLLFVHFAVAAAAAAAAAFSRFASCQVRRRSYSQNQLEGVLVAGVELRTGSIFFFPPKNFFLSIFLLPLAGFLICCTNCAPEQLHLPFEATSAALVIRSRRAVAAAGAQGLLAEHCFFFVAFFSVFPSNRKLVFKCKDGL
jgi:hypothetical protein